MQENDSSPGILPGLLYSVMEVTVEDQPRCKKCGRPLKSTLSVARGMGLKCAGIKSTSGRSVRVQSKPSSGAAYSDMAPLQVQSPLFPSERLKKRVSKRELIRRKRDERRRLFETRLPFQCGVVLPTRKPLVYTPLDDGLWQESPSGRVVSHERLQQYLVRYRLI